MRRLALVTTGLLVATACAGSGASETTRVTTTLAVTTTSVAATTTTAVEPVRPPVVRIVPRQPQADPEPPPPGGAPPAGTTGVAVIGAGGADLASSLGAQPFVRAHEGLVFPVVGREGDWLEVMTGCEDTAWVAGNAVAFTPTLSASGPVGAGFDFGDAVIVLDPGHGGPNIGAVGPGGLPEKVVNVDIARRTRDLLKESHTVDWETGIIYEGDDIPAAGTVWVTRTEGPEGADIEMGLEARARLANVAGAHAFVSIHNNAAPTGPYAGPGSEVLYQFLSEESKRLAGIMLEELRRGFAEFDADWVGNADAGARYRVRSDEVTDYYGVLRHSDVPAVIAEGAFISNADEEALLNTPAFREAYARAVYRALVRFITTDDPGSGFIEPLPRTASPGSGAPQPTCEVPAQPG